MVERCSVAAAPRAGADSLYNVCFGAVGGTGRPNERRHTVAMQSTNSGDETLRRKTDFQRLYESGSSLRASHVVLVFERLEGRSFRGGVVASRKVGKAVERNRAKRWLREAHRSLRSSCCLEGVHLVLIARRTAPSAGFHRIRDEVARLYELAGFILPPHNA